MSKKKKQSLENIIKGCMILFKKSTTDDNMRNQGLEKIIKKVKSLQPDQIENSIKHLEDIYELLKNNDKCKKKLEDLSSITTEMLSYTTSENKNVAPISSEPKKKAEKISPKNKKAQPSVKTNTPKVSPERNKDMNMFERLFKNENSQITAKLTNIENKVKTLSDLIESKVKTLSGLSEDVNHKVKQINKDTSAVIDALKDLETLPVNIDYIKDNIDSGTAKESRNNVPKDVQGIEELTKLMSDGLEQFDSIAKYYVSKQTEFEKIDKLQADLDSNSKEKREILLKEGEKKSKVAIAIAIHKDWPTDFLKMKLIFKEVMTEKYKANEEITINSENIQECEVEIEGIKEGSSYKIKTPAILIDKEVLIRATVII